MIMGGQEERIERPDREADRDLKIRRTVTQVHFLRSCSHGTHLDILPHSCTGMCDNVTLVPGDEILASLF